MSEKRRPSYALDAIKAAFQRVDQLQVTTTALRGAASLGFDRADIVATIQSLQQRHFYKSMTSHHDHRVWQDVYHAPSTAGLLYVKFTRGSLSAFLLLSFKGKDNE